MVPDTRPAGEIIRDTYASVRIRDWLHLVRGVDRFTHLPDRTPAAVVWIADGSPFDRHRTVEVALSGITIHPGMAS